MVKVLHPTRQKLDKIAVTVAGQDGFFFMG